MSFHTRNEKLTWLWLVCAVVLISHSQVAWPASAQEHAGRPEVTVWLMPNEPAEEVDPRADINREVKQFNEELARQSIVVLNTTDHDLHQQLLRWNPDFAVPEWPIIKGQKPTLLALSSFALKNGVTIRVLIVNWGQALGELRRTLESKEEKSRFYPDVAQVGSTWADYFNEHHLLLPPTADATADLVWRELPKSGPATLRYIYDIRLLYYWKRLPDEATAHSAFQMNSESWEAVIASLKVDVEEKGAGQPRPPMAFPIGEGPNVLHDYVPLVWAGGGAFLDEKAARVDLTSAAALKAPMTLTINSLFTDRHGAVHRLIAFPRMSHEEVLSPHFMRGRYRAVIEPVAFLRRWKRDFDRITQSGLGKIPSTANFWDYCGIVVAPISFKGGSDLMVVKGTPHPDVAFRLARFLASDEACMGRLARLGQLPAQDQANGFGTKELLRELDAPPIHRAAIEKSIIDAVASGREYPPFARFASDLETPEVLEAMQKIWQRIGEGRKNATGGNELRTAASGAEHAINLRINTPTQVIHFFSRYWLSIIAGTLVFVVAGAVYQFKVERNKNCLLDEIRKVRGFAASALQLVDSTHHNLSRKPDILASATEKQKVKALMIRAGLRGWRRGSDDLNWEYGKLEQVIWRAVILSIDYLYDPRLFSEWESSGLASPRAFLKQKGLTRDNPVWAEGDAPFYIDVRCSDAEFVQMALMLEHLLICLLTNALKASRIQDDLGEKPDYFQPVRIEYDRASALLILSNDVSQGQPGLSSVLCEIVNGSRTVEEFESRINGVLRGPVQHWPGIGLVEAYCMAKQCFGGLSVDAASPRVSISLKGASKERR